MTSLEVPPSAAAEQRRIILVETCISTTINALVPPAIIWALGVHVPVSLADQAATLARGTFLASFATSFIGTAIVRGRLARGAPPMARFASRVWIPRLLPLRALFLTAAALLTLLPAGLAAAQVLGLAHMDRSGLFFFNVLFGILVGGVLTPFVTCLALTDG